MKTVSYTKARSQLAQTMHDVCADHAPIIVTRQNHEDVVMMSLDDFNAWQETIYLLSSPENARRLTQSIAQGKAGKLKKRKLSKD